MFLSFFPPNQSIFPHNLRFFLPQETESMTGLMLKVRMTKFGKCQILTSDWWMTNLSCQPHEKLTNFGNF